MLRWLSWQRYSDGTRYGLEQYSESHQCSQDTNLKVKRKFLRKPPSYRINYRHCSKSFQYLERKSSQDLLNRDQIMEDVPGRERCLLSSRDYHLCLTVQYWKWFNCLLYGFWVHSDFRPLLWADQGHQRPQQRWEFTNFNGQYILVLVKCRSRENRTQTWSICSDEESS